MSSNQVIIKNKTTVSKTPLQLHLRKESHEKRTFDLCVSDQKILFKKNNIKNVNELIIKITDPIFIGCDKINLNNDHFFNKIDIKNNFKLNIIGYDGNIKQTILIPVESCLYPIKSDTIYCLKIPLGNIDISQLFECSIQLEISGFKLNKCPLKICNKLPKCVQICGMVQLC